MGFCKAMLRGTFIAKQDYIKKQEKYQINNLTLQLKQLCLNNPKVSRREEIIKIRVEIKRNEG